MYVIEAHALSWRSLGFDRAAPGTQELRNL
jgi:hypothetical protein